MTNIRKNSFFRAALCVLLIAAWALALIGCASLKPREDGTPAAFTFEVVFADGTTRSERISTTRAYVGDALLDAGVIAGEEGPYGLYVQSVYGERHVYEEGGKYWAFYIGDTYATSGVDTTPVEDGATYRFVCE